MKRGNTALKRGVGLASAFALAIAGAVIAAPAANAALAGPTYIRATPIGDVAVLNGTTGAFQDALAQLPPANYGAGTTGQVPALKVGAGQAASGFQVFIPSLASGSGAAFDSGNTFDVTLSAGTTFAGVPTIDVASKPVLLSGATGLSNVVGVKNADTVFGTPKGSEAAVAPANTYGPATTATNELTKDAPVTGKLSTDSTTLTLKFEENDPNPSLAGGTTPTNYGYLITVSGVSLNVANTVAAGPISVNLGGGDDATIGFAVPYVVSVAGGNTYQNSASPLSLPDITLGETSKVGFPSGANTTFTVSATDATDATKPAPTYALTDAKASGSSTVAATDATPAFTVTTGTAKDNLIEQVALSGQTVTGLDAGHSVKLLFTPSAGLTATTGSTWNQDAHNLEASGFPTVTLDANGKAPRIAEDSRYATAAAIAKKVVAAGTGTAVVLANGTDAKAGIDALSANFLAGSIANTPILLTDASGTLPTATVDALKDMFKNSPGNSDGEINVYIMGKSDSVSDKAAEQAQTVAKDAANAGLNKVNIVRIGGDNRYATSADVATKAKDSIAKVTLDASAGNLRTAILASGTVNADALASGGISAGAHLPVLLSGVTSIDPSVAKAIKDLGIKQLIVVGGTDRIADSVLDGLKADQGVTNWVRVAGTGSYGRYDTAVLLNRLALNKGFETLTGSSNTAYLAGGFADALTAGPLVKNTSTLLTVPATVLPTTTTLFLSSNSGSFNQVTGLGGTDRVADSVIFSAQAAVN